MHYLLTKAEFEELSSAGERARAALRSDLLALCQDVAEYKPLLPDGKPHGCIRSFNPLRGVEYCSGCPVEKLCPYENKSWSK